MGWPPRRGDFMSPRGGVPPPELRRGDTVYGTATAREPRVKSTNRVVMYAEGKARALTVAVDTPINLWKLRRYAGLTMIR